MDNNFTKNLKHIRKQKKLSQQEIADKIGVDRSTIGYWENGKADPTLLNVQKLSEALNVPLPDFLGKDLSTEDIDNTKEFTDEEKKEALKQVLKEKGFLNDDEEMDVEDFDRLIDFAKRNKDFIIEKKNIS